MYPPADVAESSARATVPVELIRSLAVLCEPPSERHPGVAAPLGLGDWVNSADYSDVFLFQLYPYASVHLGPEGMLGGVARDRIAGFWTAVGRTAPAEPDHLSALLGLYAGLAEDEASVKEDAEARLLGQSRIALLNEHLTPWVFAYLERVQQIAPEPIATWAVLTNAALRTEMERSPRPTRESAHLREAPELPDPRTEGAAAFLTGLLAPVRSGLLITRSDLARIALSLDIGLRAGERRYALEHLLAQAPGRVLTELASEANRQRDAHRARSPWAGPDAEALAERATGTSELLATLAADPMVAEAADA